MINIPANAVVQSISIDQAGGITATTTLTTPNGQRIATVSQPVILTLEEQVAFNALTARIVDAALPALNTQATTPSTNRMFP